MQRQYMQPTALYYLLFTDFVAATKTATIYTWSQYCFQDCPGECKHNICAQRACTPWPYSTVLWGATVVLTQRCMQGKASGTSVCLGHYGHTPCVSICGTVLIRLAGHSCLTWADEILCINMYQLPSESVFSSFLLYFLAICRICSDADNEPEILPADGARHQCVSEFTACWHWSSMQSRVLVW